MRKAATASPYKRFAAASGSIANEGNSVSITIEPLGGLGNQLFVYALGLSISTRLGVPLEADLRNFADYKWHNYELDSFRNSISSHRVPVQTAGAPRGFVGKASSRVLSKLADRLTTAPGLFCEKDGRFDSSVYRLADGARLRGYFQAWKYSEDVQHRIRSEIQHLRRPTGWFQETHEFLSKTGDWISVHVRRGNYIQISGMGIVGSAYYDRALSLIASLEPDLPVFVFSDDPSLAKALPSLAKRIDVHFVKPPKHSPPIESLVLMSLAKHSIIANSTFSWWGARLKREPQSGLVIFPRPWLDRRDFLDRDMFPPEWVGIGRE